MTNLKVLKIAHYVILANSLLCGFERIYYGKTQETKVSKFYDFSIKYIHFFHAQIKLINHVHYNPLD